MDNLSPGIRHAYGLEEGRGSKAGEDVYKYIMNVFKKTPEVLTNVKRRKTMRGKEPPLTLVDADGHRKAFEASDLFFFRHAFSHLLQHLLKVTKESTKTNFSNGKAWVEVAYAHALTRPEDSIVVEALSRYLASAEEEYSERVS